MSKIFTFSLTLIIFLTILQNISSSESQPEKKNKLCHVLALEGGGDKGAYQGGVIKGLIDNLPSNKTRYDVVTGISVGSINGAAFSVFEIGKEKEAADFILNTWREIKSRNTIYQNYWLGPLYGLIYKSGLYDTAPLKKFLKSHIQDRKIQKKIIIGSTNIENGTYITWDEEYFDNDTEKMIKSVLASAAFPVIFPMREVDQVSYVDGGVKNNVDISSGINKCLDMGYDEDKVVVDVILCSGADDLEDVDKKNLHPIQILTRIFEIFGYDSSMRDVENVPVNFPDIKLRYVISPTKKLPFSILPLVFSPKDIETMINIGIQDGIDAIKNNPEEGNGMEMIKEIRQKRIEENRNRNRKNKGNSGNVPLTLTKKEKLEKLRLLLK